MPRIVASFNCIKPSRNLQQVCLVLSLCLPGWIKVNGSQNHMFDGYKNDILRLKGPLVIFVSRHPRELTWNRQYKPSHVVQLALLFIMKWWSKHWFWFVPVNQAYQPWYKRRSLPPYGPYLATSIISLINKVSTKYHGQCSEKEPFAISHRQCWQLDKPIHMMRSSTEWR